MHFKTLKNKKAVSPIIATLLLILIAVAAGVIIYIWTTSYIGTQVGTMVQETFVITNVKYYISGGTPKLDVTIINQGSTAIQIVSGTLYQSDGSTVQDTFSNINTSINPGATSTLTLTLSGSLTKGQFYILQVTTVKGNTAVYRFTA